MLYILLPLVNTSAKASTKKLNILLPNIFDIAILKLPIFKSANVVTTSGKLVVIPSKIAPIELDENLGYKFILPKDENGKFGRCSWG